jgi:hypothetical protein
MGRGEAMRLTDGGAWSCGRAAMQGQQGELAEAAAPRGGIVLVQLLGESGWRRAGSSRAGSRPDLGLEDHRRCKLDTAAERRTVAPRCCARVLVAARGRFFLILAGDCCFVHRCCT